MHMSENKAVPHLVFRSSLWLLIIGFTFASPMPAEEGWLDPEFDKVPFVQWLSGGQQTSLRWSERVLPVVLSVHQRLLSRLQVQLDGAEAAKRRGEGELVFYFQFTDAKGRIYQDHTSYDLEKVEKGLSSQDLICTESAFVLPGYYSVAMAIYDTATKEHTVKRDRLRVAPLKFDPLPDAWRGLPPVEFVEAVEAPDRWFAPSAHGKLNLPVAPRRPLEIEVVMNLTPSEGGSRLVGVQDRNLSFLFPVLKLIAQMDGPQVSLNVSLVDISRRRVIFHQEDARELDWESIKKSLSAAKSGSIDVKSLADRQHNAAFFIKEVVRRLTPREAPPGAAGPARVVVVLSGPMTFDGYQDLDGLQLKLSPKAELFYIRLQNEAALPAGVVLERRRPRSAGSPYPPPGPQRPEMPVFRDPEDQLEPMMKGLEPHLFDVATAEQFRKVLEIMMSDITVM